MKIENGQLFLRTIFEYNCKDFNAKVQKNLQLFNKKTSYFAEYQTNITFSADPKYKFGLKPLVAEVKFLSTT